MSTITLTYENDENEEVVLVFPAVMEVCPECEGEGHVLCDGMRGHAYSAEEFYESFDEDERVEYFTRGGMYDQQCPLCHGKNVIPVVDEEHLTEHQKLEYEVWCEYDERRAMYDAQDRATRYAENGYRE